LNVHLLAVASALPAHRVEAAEALERYGTIATDDPAQRRMLAAMFRRSGVQGRHVVLPDACDAAGAPILRARAHEGDRGPSTAQRMQAYAAHAAPLALTASRRALDSAAVGAGAITHLVTVSCTGFQAPGVDLALVRELDLDPSVRRTHVGFMGCHGALNGMHAAAAGLAAAGGGRALLCAVELCSLHAAYGWDPGRLVPSILFGDGAAAAVLGAGQGVSAESWGPLGWRVAAHGSRILPGTEDDMGWEVGDHGFEMHLSARVPARIEEHLAPWLEGWLRAQGLRTADVRSWAVHPGGPRILDATEAGLGLPPGTLDVSRAALAEHGNLSSPTVLFLIERLARMGTKGPCVALAFGPGLAAEALLLMPPGR
jgi:predicted naringenin-chalcone synthase